MITTISCEMASVISISKGNWAFLDGQNLYQGMNKVGMKIHWPSFRRFLYNQYAVTKAVIFLGYVNEYEFIYAKLRSAGFELEFRETKVLRNGYIDGGNVDADLASYVMDYKADYNKAVIVADDADYARTIQSLNRQNKLKMIISSHPIATTSQIIKRTVDPSLIMSIHDVRKLVELKYN